MTIMQRIARYDDPRSLGSRLRKRRSVHIASLIERCFAQSGQCRILDIGGEAVYWKMFDEGYLCRHNVMITLVNPDHARIGSTSAPELFTVSVGDGCDLPYPDNAFDVVHSNSVIEHVGDWKRMVAFAAETRRLAPCYYVQMPYFWFPFEPHFGLPFFHWLPEPMRISLMRQRSCGQFPRARDLGEAVEFVQDSRLLDRKQFAFLFPDADIVPERFLGIPKSLMAIRTPSS
jgi:SAM-dependent methyltransferase